MDAQVVQPPYISPTEGKTTPVAGQQSTMPPAPNATPPKQSKFPKKLLIILGLLLFLGVVGFGIYQFVVPLIVGPKETTITWWGLWEDENIIAPLIAEYESSHPGVKIKYEKQSNQDYRERLTSALAAGDGPDIFRFHNSWVPMFASDLDRAPETVFSVADFAQTFYPVAATDLTVGAGIVGVPLEYDALTLFINTEIFTAAGKSPPKTWDELKDLARELTIVDERGVITQSGVALGVTENVDHWPEILALMMLQNRVNLIRPTGELAERALEYFVDFSKGDGVWDATLPSSTDAFAAGKLAMYFGSHWRIFEIQQKNPNLKFRTVSLPQVPKDSPTEPNVSYATYWVEGVWAKSKNKTAAWDFLKFMSQKETLEKFYQNAAAVRGMGEPYPRVEMASLLIDHPILGSIVALAPEAQSWYLASRTFDGPTGINSQIEAYFRDAVNAVNEGRSAKTALETAAAGVAQVLTQYGVISSQGSSTSR
ncbi:sugar ABC transporter substrate-binding protein [Candidatus Woesebacteria bacterium]|nr:sugar ABC transporter substrate-binding protein [Candidatus Woesebacteria bacterium]